MEHGLLDLEAGCGTDPKECNCSSILEQEQKKTLPVPGQIMESAGQWDSEAGFGIDPTLPDSTFLEPNAATNFDQSWEQGCIFFL